MIKFVAVLIILISVSLLCAKPLINPDKVMHFTSSTFVTYWSYGFNRDIMENNHQESVIFSVSITGCLGFAKEISDKHVKKTFFSWKDIAFDLAGIAFGVIIIQNSR